MGQGRVRINGTARTARTIPRAVGQVDGFKPGCGVAICVIDDSVDKNRPSRADEKREKPEDSLSDGHVSQSSVLAPISSPKGCTWFKGDRGRCVR